MTSSPASEPLTVTCARHPGVETELRCGRCDTPICPRCMVHTPGGIRCPDCAQLRRPVMYELSVSHYLRAAAAAMVVGLVLGVAAGIVLPVARVVPFFGLMLALLMGVGAGAVMAEAITRATRGKRGIAIQVAAGAGLLLAWALRLLLAGGLQLALGDLFGLIALVAAIVAASQRLR
jgi:hypothetical protein